jgi:hypothetical protein
MDEVLSEKYAGSNERIHDGDLVCIDGKEAVVSKVLMPGTISAEQYYCEDTGGVLVEFRDGFLALLPFGHHHVVVKRTE